MTNLTQFMNAAADTRPNASATIMGARKRNWHEHRERVAKLADSLRKLGASPAIASPFLPSIPTVTPNISCRLVGGRRRCADEYSLDVCRKRLFVE